jgi:hypothetical protein
LIKLGARGAELSRRGIVVAPDSVDVRQGEPEKATVMDGKALVGLDPEHASKALERLASCRLTKLRNTPKIGEQGDAGRGGRHEGALIHQQPEKGDPVVWAVHRQAGDCGADQAPRCGSCGPQALDQRCCASDGCFQPALAVE